MHRSSYDARSGSRSSNHSNSSAFSPNANPNEDWTKISDLAERRRIQNRIAQRNYRKKLKRRLEDLERRAASSASPERTHAEPVPAKGVTKTRTKQRAPKTHESKPHSLERPPVSNYYGETPDERSMFGQQCTRQLSASPPPAFSYQPVQHYDPSYRAPFTQIPIYNSEPPTYTTMTFPEYTESISAGIPMVHGALHPTRKPAYDEDIISPFGMSYASMAGIELLPQPPLPEPGLSQMPRLSYGYDDVRTSHSPETPVFAVPLTPESPPCSPRSTIRGLYEYDLGS